MSATRSGSFASSCSAIVIACRWCRCHRRTSGTSTSDSLLRGLLLRRLLLRRLLLGHGLLGCTLPGSAFLRHLFLGRRDISRFCWRDRFGFRLRCPFPLPLRRNGLFRSRFGWHRGEFDTELPTIELHDHERVDRIFCKHVSEATRRRIAERLRRHVTPDLVDLHVGAMARIRLDASFDHRPDRVLLDELAKRSPPIREV